MIDSEDEELKFSYSELLEKCKQELSHFQFVRKKDMILKLAKKLEESGTARDMISARITEDLKGYDISERYIRETLGEEFKQITKKRQKFAAQKTAKYGEPIAVSTDGSVAHESGANYPNSEAESPREPKSSTFEKPRDWELEKKEIFESNHKPDEKEDLESIRLENGKLKEMLTEQKKILDETIKSVNAAASLKKKDNVVVTDSLEYKALESQLYVIQQENKELKQIAQMQMKQNPTETFKPASEINATVLEIEFPAKEIGTFFLDCRNAKQVMFLKIAGGKVVSWESDAKRGNKRS